MLQHAGDDGFRVQVVLIGVHAHPIHVALVGRGQRAQARGAGGGVDDVGARVDLLQAGDLALALVRERSGVGAEHADRGVVGLGAGLVAGQEGLDQRHVEAADEADGVALAHGRRHDAGQVGRLVGHEVIAQDIRRRWLDAIVIVVDDGELHLGIRARHGAQRVAE